MSQTIAFVLPLPVVLALVLLLLVFLALSNVVLSLRQPVYLHIPQAPPAQAMADAEGSEDPDCASTAYG